MILFRHFTLEYRPTCSHSPYNFTARLVILSLFVGIIGSLWGGLSLLMVGLVFGLLTAMVIILMTPMACEKRDAQRNEKRDARDAQHSEHGPEEKWHTLPFQAVVNPHTHVKQHPHHEKQMAQQAQQQAQQQAERKRFH
jgi:Ca2+/Na+ antiporter